MDDGRDIYRNERLPVFAPPAVAFPTAVAHPRTCYFLGWQAGTWALFAVFQAAYFGLQSPINAEILTLLYSAATLASLDVVGRSG